MNRTLLHYRNTAAHLLRCAFLAAALLLAGHGRLNAQTDNTRIRLDMQDVPVRTIIEQIEKTTGYVFFYNENIRPKLERKATITPASADIVSAMGAILKSSGLAFDVKGMQVLITEEKKNAAVMGVVMTSEGQPLVGATVYLKSNQSVGAVTGSDGRFSLSVPPKNDVLVVTYIGMEGQEVTFTPGANLTIKLASTAVNIETTVISTGMFERDKVNFTGSAHTLSGTELRSVGNMSVIQSLKSLDPSFVVLDNLEMGADPNSMASIEVRGQSASNLVGVRDQFSGDPNAPLFVLNGVEVPLQVINDLDLNRVESVTILKDSGSTAIYGSRGANGVVVVETIKPKAGELKVAYNGDLALQMADLSVFNMMNSREKLEFEYLSGKYTVAMQENDSAEYQLVLDALYARRLRDVRDGVDTDWMSIPLRNAFTQSHAVRLSVGHEELSVDVGGKYKNQPGVMKGSKRNTWEGNGMINYRTGKFIINDYFYISGYSSEDGKYGSFSTWVNTSPYFRTHDELGRVPEFLQYKDQTADGAWGLKSPISNNISNPLYNAMLNSRKEQNQVYISNSLSLQYNPSESLRFKAGLDLARSHTAYEQFLPPEHSSFYMTELLKKGYYEYRETTHWRYSAYVNATFAKIFDGVHLLTVNARAEVRENNNELHGFTAEGFPYDSNGTPNLGTQKEQSPIYGWGKTRQMRLIGTLNYVYDERYLFDFTYSLDGSTTFGSNKLYKPFWSTGVGWNITKEHFMKGATWLDLLKLSATTGISGNQNIGRVSSSTVYIDTNESNLFGGGYRIEMLGNPDLPWQITRDWGAHLDINAGKGRYLLTVNYYNRKTDPNIIYVSQKPSTGMSYFATHMGWLENRGVEFIASYSPIYRIKDKLIWTIRATGAHNRSRFGDIAKDLSNYDDSQLDASDLRKVISGASPTAIWAVRSGGIDPATGEEIFIRKDGTYSFAYDAADQVVVGNSRPDLMGIVGTSFKYGDFTASLTFRYSFGSDLYNYALYNKVENISVASLENNQDRRALYDRWRNPGDVAEFKSIGIVENISPMTSRFVQKNNYFLAESINFAYEFVNNPWLKRNLGIQTLKLNAYVNDLFRLETSKVERGTTYPFARYFSLSISALF
ncbi:SusC/RagA family TonB-linked outer membrane protein [Alistipes sp. OttesenSCG-928-B03]|nr:SusC/RagA family TonB-linked outer membrane protein [Alistipes sp. OttesenSCG-928-B03]